MGTGSIPNPLVVPIPDNYGKNMTISFAFNDATRALTGATVTRDDGCQWSRLYLGVGPDGTVETSPKLFNLEGIVGARQFTPGQLGAVGLSTIEQVWALQITAGP
jgi:hypothetical protein